MPLTVHCTSQSSSCLHASSVSTDRIILPAGKGRSFGFAYASQSGTLLVCYYHCSPPPALVMNQWTQRQRILILACLFSLVKSVQPDASSPTHGFNTSTVYSRSSPPPTHCVFQVLPPPHLRTFPHCTTFQVLYPLPPTVQYSRPLYPFPPPQCISRSSSPPPSPTVQHPSQTSVICKVFYKN